MLTSTPLSLKLLEPVILWSIRCCVQILDFETAVMGEHFRQEQVSEQQQILEMLLTRQKQHFMLRRKIKWITSRLTVRQPLIMVL